MNELPESLRQVDWEVTTWEGARREQLRRWAELSLDEVIASLEEMAGLVEEFGEEGRGAHFDLWAHSPGANGRPQPLLEHLRNVAELAAGFAAKFGAAEAGQWLGWWHDAGKAHPTWQEFVRAPQERRGPDHSSAGMLAAEPSAPLCFNIAGHHGGLPDRVALQERLHRARNDERINEALALARRVLPFDPEPPGLERYSPDREVTGDALFRQYEVRIRMLHSALVDADCLDAEAHFDEEARRARQNQCPSLPELWSALKADEEKLMAGSTGRVNAIRAEIYRRCVSAGTLRPGAFSLTVPTGGGKTLSSLAFALNHAIHHNLDRVVTVLPYTTIIDQNAVVYRRILGDRAVLEHHASIPFESESGEESAMERWRRLMAENWDVPIVVTTTVQFFESLFSHRNGRCRKLHNLARSVVVLDEIQTFPPKLLRPTLEMLQHMMDQYGMTVLLCTATQPAWRSRPGFEALDDLREIVPDPPRLFAEMKRVRYVLDLDEPWSWGKVGEVIAAHEQILVILNTVRDAQAVLDEVADIQGIRHLSSQLCGAHRRFVLNEIRHLLQHGQPVRLVSTQVVEAGIDIDFPIVLRAIGPIDRLIQAAGRCNREGRLAEGVVIVFQPSDGGLPLDGAYRTGTDLASIVIRSSQTEDLSSPSLSARYFELLYDSRNLDELAIQASRARLAFERVGSDYRLINEETRPVVVPYSDAYSPGPDPVLARARAKGFVSRLDIRALQGYIVQLRKYVFERAFKGGLVREVFTDGGVWRWEGPYDQLRGIQLEGFHGQDLVI